MYRKILVPLDGSALSERALPFAQHVARCHGAQLVLMRAVDAHPLPAAPGTEQKEQAQRYLERVAAGLRPDSVVETGVHQGRAAEAILEDVGARQVDLVVTSTHGRSGLERLLLGSIADEVLRRCPVPVMLVPLSCEHTWEEGRPLRVLVPLDGSSLAEGALGPLGKLADGPTARSPVGEVVLLSAADIGPELIAPDYEIRGRDLEFSLASLSSYLARIAARVARHVERTSTQVTVGPASDAIVEYARRGRFDMVAMATHGRGGLVRLLLGSVAAAVVGQLKAPLLLCRPARAATPVPHAPEPGAEDAQHRRELELMTPGLRSS